jgi:head-tail adaptor
MPLMNAISDAEMTALRAEVAAAALDLDCTIQRKTATADAWGTATENWATIATIKAGMKSPTPAMLDLYAEQLGAKLAWQINFTWGTDVRIQDRLTIGTDTMVVQAILSQQSYSTLTTCLAVEIEHE